MAEVSTTKNVNCMDIQGMAPTYPSPIVLEYQGILANGEWYYTFANQDPHKTYFGLYVNPTTQLMRLEEGFSAEKLTKQFYGLKIATEQVLDYNRMPLGAYKNGNYTLEAILLSETLFAVPGHVTNREEAYATTGLKSNLPPSEFSLWVYNPQCEKTETVDTLSAD